MTNTAVHPGTKQSKIESYELVITPVMAGVWLDKNPNNRSVTQSRVASYARAMLAGRWGVTGQNIIFDKDGDLLDGQHRLWAIIEADIPVRMGVTVGIDKEQFINLDVGKPRGGGDALIVAGFTNCHQLAGAARLVYQWEQEWFGANRRILISNEDVLDIATRHPGLSESVLFVKRNPDSGMPPSEATAMHYICGIKSPEKSAEFFSRLSSGAGLEAGSPILLLKSRLIKAQASHAYRLDKRFRLALAVKAWNAFKQDQSLKILRFAHASERPEEFPTIL